MVCLVNICKNARYPTYKYIPTVYYVPIGLNPPIDTNSAQVEITQDVKLSNIPFSFLPTVW